VRRFISVFMVAAIMVMYFATPALARSPWVDRMDGGPVSFSSCIYGQGSIGMQDGEVVCKFEDKLWQAW
jgi:hypothetical protein